MSAAVNLWLMGMAPEPGQPPRRLGRPEDPARRPSFSRLWWHAASLTPEQRAAGRRWYADAAGDLLARSDEFGIPIDMVVAVAATLTPGLRWDRTLRVLDAMLRAVERGDPTFPRTGDATFGFRDREKAWQILQSGDLRLCRGPKVEPFARALAGDSEAIVIDRHLVRLATGAEVRQLHAAGMERIRASIRVIAWAMRERPADLQAALWSVRAG